MSSDEAFDASLDLLRRLNPKHISEHLKQLCQVVPDLAEDLLSSVDQPLGVRTCGKTGKQYLICDYNRDGDSYRSPWSGEYEPFISDGPVPSDELRKLEIIANDAFDIYRDLYYEGGISSAYLWDQDQGFAGVVLLKKRGCTINLDITVPNLDADKENESGVWDSIHVFEVDSLTRKSASYKVTSTIILDLTTKGDKLGSLDLSGNLTRQTERELAVEDQASHVANIGTIIEDVESKLRNMLNEVYFGKTRDIIGDLRSKFRSKISNLIALSNQAISTTAEEDSEKKIQGEIAKGLGA